MRKIRWGVLGVAKIATEKVIPAMQRGQWSEVTAIASRDLEKARAAAAKLGIQKAYGSYEELLADPDVDAIYNPLPNHLHVPWTIKAAERRKHVLCEKPIALSAAEARELVAVRDRTRAKIQEAFMVRTHPQWLTVKELIAGGRIGDVRAILGVFAYTNRDPANIRNRPDYGGGALMDIGCYLVNTARFIFGREPLRVTGAIQRDPDMATDRLTSILLDFGSGHAAGSCSTQMVFSQQLQIFGTTGRIELPIPFNAPPDRLNRIIVDTGVDLFGGGISHIDIDVCNQYTIQGDLFSRAILDDEEVPLPLEDAVRNMACIDALFKSAETGRWEGTAVTVPIYLGLDSSTQSVTATAVDIDDANPDRRAILFERSFRYDDTFPHYGTEHGVLRADDPRTVHAPPLMWSEALDRIMSDLVSDTGVDWSRLRAISGSAQQHGSVYLNARARQRLGTLDPSRPLAAQLEDVFSRRTSPIWMDSSTTSQCAAIEAAVGGPRALARLTGSRAFERFTGPQIRKFAEDEPDAYAATDRVHLVSSWLASLLAGAHVAIDPGDGSGMNLMDLASKQWSPEALLATARNLETRLPPLAESWTVLGTLAPYWQRRYSLPAARIVAWSGDNPCSLVGTGLVREGVVAISLGTSDTIFGIMPSPRPSDDGTGHVFASPTGAYMGMTVFKNGSLARERVRDAYGMDWSAFSSALARTPAGNRGATMLPWFDPEITPLVLEPGVRRYGLEPADADGNVRAVVEAQMMSLALHSRWMGVKISSIYATGGASANRDVLQVMADVFDADVLQLETGNSAALGAALRAFHADRLADGQPVPWEEVIAGFVVPRLDSRLTPQPANVATYKALIEVYADREREALALAGK